ncbi:MAG: gamma carbonic anhydrase family protein [Candidatus Helarchaeota archaeon]
MTRIQEAPRVIKSPVDGKMPQIDPSVFIAPTATIIGNVEIAENTNIWYNAVIRAEASTIKIGKNCSIQEGVVIHTEPGTHLTIGDNVLMGHCAMVHGPGTIGQNVMIGISATVLQNHSIPDNVIIAAGAVVRGQCETMGMYAGIPAKRLKDIRKSAIRNLSTGITFYVENGKKFKAFYESEK